MRQEIRIRQDGTHVLLIVGGKLVADLPWDAALDVAQAIKHQARRAEELAKAVGVAFDQAILIRSGAPFGLTSHPAIQAEAAKLAAWDSSLRRYMSKGIRSEEQFGMPGIKQYPPARRGKVG